MRQIIGFAILLVVKLSASSQELRLPSNIQSPNAANLGKYGDVPVSYFTGTPNISIPIHTLTEGEYKVPITLSYDASGIRLDNHPTWVGQNWSLSAGGVITRTIRGDCPDECSLIGTGYGGVEENIGFFYRGSELSETSVNSVDKLKNLAYKAVTKGYDYEPDIFTFNFMGKTGKFFMGNDGQWKIQSDDNLLVIDKTIVIPRYEYLPGGSIKYPKVLGGFKLKDDTGTTYVFGYDDNAVEYGINLFYQVIGKYLWQSNAWYLTKVIDKFGHEVFNFTYERGENTAQFYRATGTTIRSYSGSGIDPSCYSASYSGEEAYVEGYLISPVYLKRISTSNTAVSFSREISNELSYNSVDLNYKVNDIISKFCPCTEINPFYYLGAPFSAAELVGLLKWNKLTGIDWSKGRIKFVYNNNGNERLNLLRVDFYGEDAYYNYDNPKKYSYNFYYNNFQSLPGYLSKKVDHWGYYNGKDYAINSSNYNNYFDQRVPDANFLQIGMLYGISYPTGGSTIFEYEPHWYSKYVSDDHLSLNSESCMAGGLRIKRISEYDGKIVSSKSFKYISDYESNKNSSSSSGILTSKPKYYWPNWSVRSNSSGTYTQSVFSINSIIPLSNVFGTHIGYSKVEEVLNDGSYTVYQYSNYDTNSSFFDESPLSSLHLNPSPYDQYSDLNITRGKLLSSHVYDKNNLLVQKHEYKYRDELSSLKTNTNYFVVCTNARYQNVCNNSAVSIYKGNAYKLYFLDYDVIEDNTTDYLNGIAVMQKTSFIKQDNIISNVNVRLTKQVINDVNDGQLKIQYSFPYDLSSEPNVNNLISNFRVNEVIKTQTLKNSTPIGTKKVTYKIENNLCVPDTLYTSDSDDSHLKPEVYYDKYDDYGNLLQYHKDDGIYNSVVWGCNKRNPVLKGLNIQYSNLNSYVGTLNQYVGNYDPSTIIASTNTIRDAFPNSSFTSYSYYYGCKEITSITDPNKKTEFYNYDLFNRLYNILDEKKNVLKQYSYNYTNSYPYLFMSNIICSESYNMGDIINFKALVVGGSNNLSFTWILSYGGNTYNFNTGNTPTLSTRLIGYGNLNISCTVNDLSTGQSYTCTKNSYIREATCKFIDVIIHNPSSTWSYTEGNVYSPLDDEVSLFLLSQCTNGAKFYIGNQVYTMSSYGAQTVKLPISAQTNLSCKVEIPYGFPGAFATIQITGLTNNSARIENSTISTSIK